MLRDWYEIQTQDNVLRLLDTKVRTFQKNLKDGRLTVLISRDDGFLHMSISHRIDTRQGPKPGRYPTWDEIKEARYKFCPDEVTMAMYLPPKSEYVNVHETTFHLWETQ